MRNRPVKRCQPLGSGDKLLLKLMATCLFGMATAVVFQPPEPTPWKEPHHASQEVKLWKGGREIDLAALTPNCDVHDIACVLGTNP